MNKKFYGTLLLGTLLLGSTIVSCKDYDDDIDNLQNQITQLATKADMQSEVSKLQSAVATAQAAAENKAAAAEQAAKDAAAKAQAAADAAAKAQGTADAAVEALNKVAADAAAAAKAAEDAKAAAEAKAAELEAQLAELQALAATLVSTTDFEAAKKELNDKYAELAAKIGETTGTTGMTGLSVIMPATGSVIDAGYGVFQGSRYLGKSVEWDGPKAEKVNAIEKGTYLTEFGTPNIKIAVNPTDLDLSGTTFAVVNQYNDVAPIAFGTPSVPTRGSGIYELPFTAAGNLSNEKVKEFMKNFDGDGATAVLVSGKIASQASNNFVRITENDDHDYSSFATDVAYEDVDGTIDLKINNPEFVLDAYIAASKSDVHDSLLYKVKYNELTVTYDAAAVKKQLDKEGVEKVELLFQVNQINLNGVIHKYVETLTFKAKPAAAAIEKDIPFGVIEHQAKINVWVKANGKNTDYQKIEIKNADILEALGLSDKKSDEYIHYMHALTLNQVSIKYGTPYYCKNQHDDNCDEEHINIDWILKGTAPKLQDVTRDWTIEFVKDYIKSDGTAPGGDVVMDEKTLYIPVDVTVDDQTNSDDVKTIYHVEIPVKFKKISLEGLYKWNNTKMLVSSTPAYWDFASNFEVIATENNITDPVITGLALDQKETEYSANGKKKGQTGYTSTAYIVPSVTVSGQLNDSYKKIIAEQDELGYTTTDEKADFYTKTQLNHINSVYPITLGGSKFAQYGVVHTIGYVAYSWHTTDGRYNPTAWEAWTVTQGVAHYTTTTGTSYDHIALDPVVGVDAEIMKNSTYTVSGLYAKAAKRNIELAPMSVEFYTTPAAPTATMTTTAKFRIGDTYLYNALIPAENTGNYDGAFTLTNEDGKTMRVGIADGVNITSASLVKIIKADGTEITSAPTGFSIAVKSKTYDVNTTAGTKANGLVVSIAGVETGDKIVCDLKIKSYVHNLETSVNTADVIYKNVVLEIE